MTAEEASRASHRCTSPAQTLPRLSPARSAEWVCLSWPRPVRSLTDFPPSVPDAAGADERARASGPVSLLPLVLPPGPPRLPYPPGNIQAIDIAALPLLTALYRSRQHGLLGHVRMPFWWLAAAGLLEADERHTQARWPPWHAIPQELRLPDT